MEKPKKNIQFHYRDDKFSFICDYDEQLSSLFERFKERTNTNNLDLYFVSNGITLDPKNKLNQINLFEIEVYEFDETRGGGLAMKFTDVNKQIVEKLYFSKNAPSYRKVVKGINIFGICKVNKCEAHDKEVAIPLKNKKFFNLV